MKQFSKIDLAVGSVAILAIFSVTVYTVCPAIRTDEEGNMGMLIVTGGILIFAIMQFLLQRKSHYFQKEFQEKKYAFDIEVQIENQRFERKVQAANYNLALYDKRVEFYLIMIETLRRISEDRDRGEEALPELIEGLRKHQFILPSEQRKYVEEVISRANDSISKIARFAADQNRVPPPDPDKQEEEAKLIKKQLDWLAGQYSAGLAHEVFEPILELPESLDS